MPYRTPTNTLFGKPLTHSIKKLGLSEKEQNHFCDLVEANHGRAKKGRKEAMARVAALKNDYNQLTLDAFKVISDWYHFAILELLQIEGFQNDPVWIGRSLGISPHEANVALDRLTRLEMIEEQDGRLKLMGILMFTPLDLANGEYWFFMMLMFRFLSKKRLMEKRCLCRYSSAT